MKIILASNNKGKIREIKEILGDLNVEIQSQDQAGFGGINPEEDGETLEANAIIKVDSIASQEPVLGDDTGLFVKALEGPGVRTARFAGENATDGENRAKMLREMEGIEDRKAEFRTVLVLKYQGKYYKALGTCQGSIAAEELGSGGFGYDSIFIPDGYTKTFAQLDEDTKNSISHRKKAIENLGSILRDLISG